MTIIDKIKQIPALIRAVLPLLLFTAGIVAFIVAGYLVNSIVGTVVLGLACMFSGWIVTPDTNTKGVTK